MREYILSQKEFCKILKISQSTYSNICYRYKISFYT
ncbi:hypothetical protein [Clostridium sp.]